MKFAVEIDNSSYYYHIEVVPRLSAMQGTIIAQRRDLLVTRTDSGENRLIGVPGAPEPYAYYCEFAPDRAKIQVSAAWLFQLGLDTSFTSLLALERRMIEYDSLVLHCAYLRQDGRAILFSAPSGTGKSTQAGLWEQYRGGQTINGDRALLQKKDGKWQALGWPVCGSSEICHNLATPVRAVVMLSQGKEDVIERLTPARAFSAIYTQITVNSWNKEFCQRAGDVLERLVQEVPVFHLSCTISEHAVECLERALDQGKV